MSFFLVRTLAVAFWVISGSSRLALADAPKGPIICEGNGTERGGGDQWAQEFIGAGRQALSLIQKWQSADPRILAEIDTSKLEELFEDAEDPDHPCRPHNPKAIRVVSKEHVYLWIRGKKEEVEAANNFRRKLVELNRTLWDKRGTDPVGKAAFALHEYCRFMRIKDAQYHTSDKFLDYWDQHFAIEGFKTELKNRLERIAASMEGALELHHWAFSGVFETVRTNSDFRNCQDLSWERLPRLVACQSVLKMMSQASDAVTQQIRDKGDLFKKVNQEQLELDQWLKNQPGARAVFAQEQVQDLRLRFDPAAAQISSRVGQEFFPSLRRICRQTELSVRISCAMSSTSRFFAVELPSRLEQCRSKIRESLEKSTAQVQGYREELLSNF